MIKTKEIYDILSRGGFICQDSAKAEIRRLYDYIEENFAQYKEYYSGIGFSLEQGNGYFHFTRDESRTELSLRLARLGAWIDRLDFMKTFHGGFSTGLRFTPSAIAEAASGDVELKEKAQKLYPGQRNIKDAIQTLVGELEKAGFIELENEYEQMYKVTSSFHYLEDLVEMLTISEEEANEKAE